jgi:O-antigen biosynthesis protein
MEFRDLVGIFRARPESSPPQDSTTVLRQQILASGLFDPDFYLAENDDVARSGIDPLDHYVRHGGFEQRNPSAAFDATAYCETYPEAATSGLNLLIYYLNVGAERGHVFTGVRPAAPPPSIVTREAWHSLAQKIAALAPAEPEIDVVVPIYRGLEETANCLYSAMSSRLATKTPFAVIAIDDCGPEPELAELLDYLAGLGVFSLLRNASNLGFVGTVNRGMSLHADRDVVLLNSDTEVYGDWLDRLRASAYAQPSIGTATPFSNNASICSYPYFCRAFGSALELPFDALDSLAADVNHGMVVEIPTAVGFCMYIRRDCLDEVGLFDVEKFGRGYGEENDFCCRLIAKGWRNVLATDVFVRHFGGVSFGAETSKRVQAALKVMDRLHPTYLPGIDAFCRRDPVKNARRRLDIARLRHASGSGPSVMMVSHHLGGGTKRHIDDLCAVLRNEGIPAYILEPKPANGAFGRISHPEIANIPNLGMIDIKHGLPDACELLRALGVFHMHIHHLFGYDREAFYFFPALCRAAGIAYDFTVHDYTPACPRVNMIDASGLYCDKGEVDDCEACIKASSSPYGDVGIGAWRAQYEIFLRGARKVFVPDEDVRRRLQWLLPEIDVTIRPHPELVSSSLTSPRMRGDGEESRVAVIGALGPHKGSAQLKACAEDALSRRLPIKFILFGYSNIASLVDLPNVEITGRYEEKDLPALLARRACHLAFIPSVWPETYCYVLSSAFHAGLFPVAFDLGAIAHRIRDAGWGTLLPLELAQLPGKINDALLAVRVPPMPETARGAAQTRYENMLADYYEIEERGDAERPPRAPVGAATDEAREFAMTNASDLRRTQP